MAQKAATLELDFNGSKLLVELAISEQQRNKGLSGRKWVPDGTGMVFLFNNHANQRVCMWMRDTRVGLDAAFVASDGWITDIYVMSPHDETPHCASETVKWVIEAPGSWFLRQGIYPGMRLSEENLAKLKLLG